MNQHYFSESPAGARSTRTITVELAGEPRSLVTAGGVFSPDHLDRGTEVLLHASPVPDRTGGAILDIGCGWGPIALDAALSAPEREVWAIDVNERSLELTRENAERLGVTNLRVSRPEEVPPNLRFSEIRSNPPIRVGKEVLHDILREWLPRLDAGGTAHLVVAKHLGAPSLQRWIADTFPELEVDRIARDRGFHVIRAVRL